MAESISEIPPELPTNIRPGYYPANIWFVKQFVENADFRKKIFEIEECANHRDEHFSKIAYTPKQQAVELWSLYFIGKRRGLEIYTQYLAQN